MTHLTGWLELLVEQALLVAALLVVFDGTRRLARDGLSRRAALLVAAGLVLPVVDAAFDVHVVKSVQALQADKLAAVAVHGREPVGGWASAASSPEQRSALSLQAATVNYLFQGLRTDVLDADGQRVRFVPAPDQERAREQFVRDEKGAESAAQASWDRGMRLFIETALFLAAGVLVGRRARRA